jgi:hypothetical protein
MVAVGTVFVCSPYTKGKPLHGLARRASAGLSVAATDKPDAEATAKLRWASRKAEIVMRLQHTLVGIVLLAAHVTVGAQAVNQPALMDRIKNLETQVQTLQSRLSSVSNRVPARWASLDCNSGKYDEFLFNDGHLPLFAACTNIEPYLEGHRIRITVGNPHSFNFSNVKGTLGYGKTVFDAFDRKVEVSTTEVFRAGTWTVIVVNINPSKAEDLRSLVLELSAATASSTRQ